MSDQTSQSALEVLRSGPFAVLGEKTRHKLASRSRIHAFIKGESLYREGQSSADPAFLMAGLVQLTRSAARGRECMLHLIRPGHMLDAGVLFYEGGLPASAVALTDGRLLCIEKAALLDALQQCAALSLNIMAAFALRQRLFIHKLAGSQGRISAAQRVAAWLLHRSKMDASDKLDLGVSREVLARLMGLSRESLCRQLSGFNSQELISLQGRKVELLQKEALRRLADSV